MRGLLARLVAVAAVAALAATVGATVSEALRDPDHLAEVTSAVTGDPALLDLVATATDAPAPVAAALLDGLPGLLATTDAGTVAAVLGPLVADTPLAAFGTLLESGDAVPRDGLAVLAATLLLLTAVLTPPPLGRRAGAVGRVLLLAGLPLVALTYAGPWLLRAAAPRLAAATGVSDAAGATELVAGLAERVLPVLLGPALTLAVGLAVAGAGLVVVRLVLGGRRG